jgi:hypothetical protein
MCSALAILALGGAVVATNVEARGLNFGGVRGVVAFPSNNAATVQSNARGSTSFARGRISDEINPQPLPPRGCPACGLNGVVGTRTNGF